MEQNSTIAETNPESAKRAAETFIEIYEVTLVAVEHCLEEVIKEAGPEFAEGYFAWYEALHQLIDGINALAANNVNIDEEAFNEALHLFSFDGAVQFLRDLCIVKKIALPYGWREQFKTHILSLLEVRQVTAC